MTGFHFRSVGLANLEQRDEQEMTALAASVCPGAGHYLVPRLATYGHAICAFDAAGLAAFELIDEFQEFGERWLYLGPLFSRDGACIPLFCSFVGRLLERSEPFHLLAETQNPEAVLLLKTLFARASYPAFGDEAPPVEIVRIAKTFARRLDHIHGFDAANLSTRSGETLFRRKRGCDPVLRWLERRGVLLERGDSQVFVLSCPDSRERIAALADFRAGVQRLADWERERPRMLACFEGAACHA